MSDHYDTERIRRGLALLVEDAPLAPEFEDLTTTYLRPVETRPPRRSVAAGLAAAAVIAAFVVGGVWLGRSGGSSDPAAEAPVASTDLATTQTTLADLPPGEFPRVLLDAPNWALQYIDFTDGETAEGEYATADILFTDGSVEAELRMNSGWHADLKALIEDRVRGEQRHEDHPIWDTTAVVVGQDGSGFTAMWQSNDVEYEFLAYGDIDEETFRSVLSSLTQMMEEDWMAVLPDEIVTDRAGAVATYLEDVPLPPDFDTASVIEGPIEHWYGVAADTMSAVSCSWIEVWIDAKEAGDTETVQTAIDAMASSHNWQVLADMATEGEFPNVVREYADAIAGDGTIEAGTITTVEASYKRAFGCN